MKKLIFGSLFIIAILAFCAVGVLALPYYHYNKIVNLNEGIELYSISRYSKNLINKGAFKEIETTNLPNEDLWESFHISDLKIPLPVKNPFFFVTPVLDFRKKTGRTQFGLSLYNVNKQNISRVFFLPNKQFPNFVNSQKLFELPVVKKHLDKFDDEKVWADVFTKDIQDWNITYESMIYNLYLLNFRSQFFNMNFKKLIFYKETNTGVIELETEK